MKLKLRRKQKGMAKIAGQPVTASDEAAWEREPAWSQLL